ncbi:MAG: pirin family protein [Halioglobus sp.]
MKQREIIEVRSAHPSRDGDGVAIQRITGMRHRGMDPLLMIDELRSEQREDFAGGFPPHPHRGMQTLTYLKKGGISHRDSEGNSGEIRGGGVQWMSAGRGIIHSEMPTPESDGLHGFQLWVNLPAHAKMSQPRYRDISVDGLGGWHGDGVDAVALSGEWSLGQQAVVGPLDELAMQAAVLDMTLAQGTSVTLTLDPADNLVGYVYAGALLARGRMVAPRQMLITDDGDQFTLHAGDAGASLLLVRGKPLGEPVANYGPFVMNTAEEIESTLRDYQSGQFP